MESRNVKTIDENGIDRTANVICGFALDGSNYVLYSILRTGSSEPDKYNLFVSKLVENNDKTSNMVNIEDKMEKIKVGEIAKDLVTYSLRNEKDHADSEIELAGGNKVKIIDVLFNKEQNINVKETYITSVDPAVSRASENFYKVVNEPKTETPELPVEEPAIVEPITEPSAESEKSSIDEEIMMAMPELNLETPVVEEATPLEVDEPVKDALDVPESINVNDMPKVEEVPVIEEEPKAVEPEVVAPEPVAPLPTVEPEVPEVAPAPEPTQVAALVAEVSEPQLLFDASTESNLNKALDEVSDEKVVAAPQEGVESLREFGTDEPAVEPEVQDVKKLTRSKGFANNKFFMAIAIIFFVLACVFLGYEAFQYFQLR